MRKRKRDQVGGKTFWIMSAQLTPDKLSENVIKLNIVSPKFKANSNAETDDEDDDFEILMMKMVILKMVLK